MYKRAFPCRCNRAVCQHRQSLAMRPEHYLRPRKCRKCKRGTMRLDPYRLRREHSRTNCDCHGYGFRHRRGSLWCVFGKGEVDATDVVRRYGTDGDPLAAPF